MPGELDITRKISSVLKPNAAGRITPGSTFLATSRLAWTFVFERFRGLRATRGFGLAAVFLSLESCRIASPCRSRRRLGTVITDRLGQGVAAGKRGSGPSPYVAFRDLLYAD